jgi:F420-dependent oxidoreductase-like protein
MPSDMRLGLNLGYSGSAAGIDLSLVQEADRLGYHSVWSAEAYGSDAVTPLTWVAARTERIRVGTAIMQIAARTPALTATTALTLDQLSGGRFLLGLGVSGPQVVEGWHGVPFGKPLARTREYVEVVRTIWRREKAVEFTGAYYQIPYRGADATGLGKPLKSILHGRADIPIYLAAIGPRNVALAAEIADGFLPIFFSPERAGVFRESLEAGFRAAGGGKSLATFDMAPTVVVVPGDDVAACRAVVKPQLALYVGGMGARGKNFYNELVCRYGYEADARRIQDLYLGGQREAAVAAVPDALVDEVALCGPRERIRERLAAWKASGVTTLICAARRPEAVRLMAELVL